MPNIIIFDAEYIAELVSGMHTACDLVNEAVESLKAANSSAGWKCKEKKNIADNLAELNKRLKSLDNGVNETTRVLGSSVGKFAELEGRYRRQAEALSDELRNSYGFKASGYVRSPGGGGGGGGTPAPAPTPAPVNLKDKVKPVNSPEDITNPAKPAEDPASPVQPVSPETPGTPGKGRTIPVVPAGEISKVLKKDGTPLNNTPSDIVTGGKEEAVNLPVTRIPVWEDSPSLPVGVKAAQEIEEIAVMSVADSITDIISGPPSITAMTPTQRETAIRSIVRVYSAGRTVVENSSAIIANPTQPNTQERIAMAAGLVELAGSTTTGLASVQDPSVPGQEKSGSQAEKTQEKPQNNEPKITSAEFSMNAESVISNMGEQDSKEAKEVQAVLKSVSGGGSESLGSKYLNKIKSSIMSKLRGGTSSLAFGPLNLQDFLSRIF